LQSGAVGLYQKAAEGRKRSMRGRWPGFAVLTSEINFDRNLPVRFHKLVIQAEDSMICQTQVQARSLVK
jgi:hypothetical protein